MKSVMQEASSLAKAIEQGWEKAGKPAEFSIKILEEAQKNFIGMTTRSAKVAIFFDEKPAARETQQRNAPASRPQRKPAPASREQREQREQREPVTHARPLPQREPRAQALAPERAPKPVITQEVNAHADEAAKPRQSKQFAPLWNDEMVTLTHDWVKDTLKTMHLDGIAFTVQPQNFHLRIVFDKPLLGDTGKEKQLFASFSTLILETLKGRFRMGFRGHKIVLTHASEQQ